ncbi:MAG TPA: alpha/beta hydrolase [Acidimicrobiales bacterium]|nr:alpha/beta hydrolase [Acidimicrobiales bacterium]
MDFIDRVDPELRAVLGMFPEQQLDFSLGLDVVRKLFADMRAQVAATAPEVPGVEFRDTRVAGYADGDADVLVRIYEASDRHHPSGAIYWIHGGGMVVGSYDENDYVSKLWADRFKVAVVSVEYRLAPEHPYPSPVEDCYAGLRWLWRAAKQLGVDQSRIVVAGASAGGGLAAGTCLMARDHGEVHPCAQLLMYPMIDDRDATPANHEITYPKVWHRDANRFGWASYLGERAGTDDVPIYAAPARATVEQLRGLPPAFVDVGELDAFRDEDIDYAQKLLQAAVPTELLVSPGVFHASENFNASAASSRRINRFRNEALARALAHGE